MDVAHMSFVTTPIVQRRDARQPVRTAVRRRYPCAHLSGTTRRQALLLAAAVAGSVVSREALADDDLRPKLKVSGGSASTSSTSEKSVVKTVTRGVNLEGANFSGQSFEGVSFQQSILRQADFSGAKLRDASFFDADLSGASFAGADLRGANVSASRQTGMCAVDL